MLDMIMTVTGAVPAGGLGFTLPHEHIMSTFGAQPARYPDYPISRLLDQVLPYLASLKTSGLSTVADCTAAYFGRHPELLKRISQESGIHLITNTGYYGAAYGRYIPVHAHTETSRQIAARWIHEWQDGIDETGVRPGFIKTAVGDGPLNEMATRLIRAAALTHLQTGLTIQTHLGDNTLAAHAIFALLAEEKVHPSAWTWVHAWAMQEMEPLLEAARRGAWISLDGVSAQRTAHILGQLQALKRAGFLGQVLLSHDGDSFTVDGSLRPYDYLLAHFLPLLRENGFSEEELHQLTVENPSRAFAIHVRESAHPPSRDAAHPPARDAAQDPYATD